MKQFFSNPYVIAGLVILVIVGFHFAYKAGRRAELQQRLARINDTLQNTRASDESHLKLMSMRTAIIEKLKSL